MIKWIQRVVIVWLDKNYADFLGIICCLAILVLFILAMVNLEG